MSWHVTPALLRESKSTLSPPLSAPTAKCKFAPLVAKVRRADSVIPVAALTLALTACSTQSPGNELDDDRPLVLATFTVLADMARNVAADRDAVTHALERTGLSNLADRQIGALSGGQRKHTFVACALAQNADVLPLDEPFAGVDKHSEATVIGVVFTALFALGLVLTSRVPSQTGLGHILFGNVLGVSDGDIAQILVLAVLVLAVVWYKHRDLTLYAFDPVHAHAIGLSPVCWRPCCWGCWR